MWWEAEKLAVMGTLKMRVPFVGKTAQAAKTQKADIPFIGNATDALMFYTFVAARRLLLYQLPLGGHFQINSLYVCEQMCCGVLQNSASLNRHKDSEVPVFPAYSEHVTTASCTLEYACFCQNCSASEAVTQTDCDCCGGGK